MLVGVPEALFIVAIAATLGVPACRICAKAGYSAWLGLLAVAPIANLVLLFYLAFAKWPIERR